MRLNKWLVAGLAGAVGLGALLVAVPVPSRATEDDRAVTVPVGRIGDEVEYTDFFSIETNGTLPYPWRTHSQSLTHQEGLRIVGIVPTKDSTGLAHETLDVARVDKFPDFNRDFYSGFRVDLHSRDLVRETTQIVDTGLIAVGGVGNVRPPSSVLETNASRSWNWFGPRLDAQVNGFEDTSWDAWLGRNHSLVRFQGYALHEGEDFTSDNRQGNLQSLPWSGRWWLYGDVKVLSYEFRSWVDQAGEIDGRTAMAVRSDTTIVFETVPQSELPAPSVRGTFAETDTLWLRDGDSYPVFQESIGRHTTPLWNLTVTHRETLAAYRPGGTEIPWKNGATPVPLREERPGLERSSPASRHPTDGTGSELPFALSLALSSVEGDSTLREFLAWRQQHPSYRLIGAELMPVQAGMVFGILRSAQETDSSLDFQWVLVFGDLTEMPRAESTFAVASQRNLATGVVTNKEAGAVGLGETQTDARPYFTLAEGDLPTEPVALAAAEAVWTDVAADLKINGAPNMVYWGCGTTAGCAADFLAVLVVGRYEPSGPAGAPGAAPLPTVSLVLNASSGNVAWTYSPEIRTTNFPFSPLRTASTPDVQPLAVPPRPRFEAATPVLASASLLAVLLLAYFFPLVKYAATNALVFFSGYAKLRKADLLNNKIRDQMLQLIKADPGITPPQLQAAVQAGWSTIVYHLGVLEKNQLASSLIDGRHKRFFPVGEVDHGKRGQLAALKNERTRQLYEIVLEEPGAIQKELIQRLGISQPAVAWHVRRLEAAGLLGHDKRGHTVSYFANPRETMVGRYDPTKAVEVA